MTFFLPANEVEAATDRAPIQTHVPGFGEAVSTAATAQRIEDDSWRHGDRVAQSVLADLEAALGDDYGPGPQFSSRHRGAAYEARERKARIAYLTGRIAELRGAGQGALVDGLPDTPEAFDDYVIAHRRAEWEDAMSVGARAGGVANFVGRTWAAGTDEASLFLLPLGAGAGAGLRATIAIEAGLGAVGEAMVLPRQFEVANELDIDRPNPLVQIAAGAALGGGLAGTVGLGARALDYRAARTGAAQATRPEGSAALPWQARITRNAEALAAGGQVETAPPPIRFADFDFSAKGNASPSRNRVGYVFGKLLGMGYTPEQASGLVGNLMQESGGRLNTGAVGDNGNAIGIGQWNGPRRHALVAFAESRNRDWTDLDTQIAFLDHELKTTERAAWDKIRQGEDPAEIARLASVHFWRPGVPHLANRMGYAATIWDSYAAGRVPSAPKGGAVPAVGGADVDFAGYTTGRGYTASGQVTAGDGLTVDVEYLVVDLSDLERASGTLQPRDRSRAASVEQVEEIAARLDPARLMPSPEADRGAPIVGPDMVIESGNGRSMALDRAYARYPDRAEAYRAQIEAAGYEIPEGVERPVLIGKRVSEMTEGDRVRFAAAANQSQIARMSATERAASDARALDAETVALFVPDRPLSSSENTAFTRRALAALPQAERAGLVTADGKLNAEGQLRLRQALFARAYDAPDLLARYTETGAGDLRSLMDALEQAAPAWAALRTSVTDGRVAPEFDLSPFVLDAMRLIASAREVAARDGKALAAMIEELLADIDLLDGAVHPLTRALVRMFAPGGRAAPAARIAEFLKRFADEAQTVGGTEAGLFDAPSVVDVLRRMEPDTFAEVTDATPPAAARAPAPAQVPARVDLSEGASSPLSMQADDVARAALEAPAAGRPAAEVFGGGEIEAVARGAAVDDMAPDGQPAEAELTDQRAVSAAQIDRERRVIDDLEPFEIAEGIEVRPADWLDEIEQDEILATIVDACSLKGAA